MKKSLSIGILFILIFVGQIRVSVSGSWEMVDSSTYIISEEDPYSQSFTYYGLECYDSLNCVAIGNLGLSKPWNNLTRDGGDTWAPTLRDSCINVKARDVAYPGPELCIAICDSGYYWISRDSCKSWVKKRLKTIDRLFYDVHFIDSKTGIMINGLSVFLTRDGAYKWDSLSFVLPDTLLPFYAKKAYLNNYGHIIILAYDKEVVNYIVRSEDWGETWTAYTNMKDRASGIYFIDDNTGWSAGGHQIISGQGLYTNVIQKTSDGGQTWRVQLDTVHGDKGRLRKIYFSDEFNGIALGDWHSMWITNDGGETWTDGSSYEDISFDYFSDIAYLGKTTNFLAVTTLSGLIYRYIDEANDVYEQYFNFSPLAIYPNPAQPGESINIKYTSSSAMEIEFRVYDSMGRLMDEPRKIFSDFGEHSLRYSPGRNFPPGVYWVKALCGGVVLSGAFVVE